MSKQRQAEHRHPDCPEYPYIDPEIRLVLDRYLSYFEGRALATFNRMRKIPKKERQEWYQNCLRYHKNCWQAFKLARKINLITANNNASKSRSSTQAFDPAI